MLKEQEFETAQCIIRVFDTGFCVDYYHIYCVKSYHKKTKKIVTRFGTETQIKSMLKSYHKEKRFKL